MLRRLENLMLKLLRQRRQKLETRLQQIKAQLTEFSIDE